MHAIPGGRIDPKDVVGRDKLIDDLWRMLEKQSVIVVAERRMGKTSIATKMRSECRDGKLFLYRDVEGVQSPLEFVERVYEDIEKHFSVLTKGAGLVRKFLGLADGAEIGGVLKFPPKAAKDWKHILECAIRDLAEHLNDTLVIFVWDELPLMLQKVVQSAGPQTAMDLLDTLRGLRQSHPGIRMIFTGSIGLHHVIGDLKAAGHMNDATNNMCVFEVPELADVDAADLSRRLLAGEQLHTSDIDATIAALIEHTNAIPFYIHHVIAVARSRGTQASAALVADIVEDAMVGAHNPWQLDHFRIRLGSYYGQDRLPVVLKILDDIAVAEQPVTFKHIFNCITGSMSPETSPFTARILKGDQEALRTLLKLLQRDHYLQQEKKTGNYCFRFRLIERWWRLHRNLMP